LVLFNDYFYQIRYMLSGFHKPQKFLIELRRNTVTCFKHHWTTKWIALMLAVGLLWGGQLIFPRESGLEGLFKWAVKNYLDGKYREVVKDLELLLSYCDEGHKELKGKIYLLMGAVHEQLGNIQEARKNYQLSLDLLETPSIEGIDFTSLEEYQRTIMNKKKPLAPGIIEKPKAKPEKKRSSSLAYMVIGGVVIAMAVVLLSSNRDKRPTVTYYELFLYTNGSGSINNYPGRMDFAAGTQVRLTAEPDIGWQFAGWGGDLTGNENPVTITMNSDKYITANFTEITPGYYGLAVSIMGQGSVTLDPAGGSYLPGTTVKLTAIPGPGWEFYSWYGDLSVSENPVNIMMDFYKSVTAAFIEASGPTKIVGHILVFSRISTNRSRMAMPFTMPEDGTINSITMYHLGGSGRMILAVYDGEDLPENRLGVTVETNINSSDGWQTINLTSPATVRGGQTIWLAWVYSTNPGIALGEGSPAKVDSAISWVGGMPEQFGTSYYGSPQIISIYATYTPD
jgi:uncharacterized repeat protein (TIGR02543 family)